MKTRPVVRQAACLAALVFVSSLLFFPPTLSAQTVRSRAEILTQEVLSAKENFTPAQQKMDSAFVFAGKKIRGELAGLSFADAIPTVSADLDGLVTIDIQADPQAGVDAVAGRLATLGGQVVFQSAEYNSVRARIPLVNIEVLATDNAVRFIYSEDKMLHNSGSLSTQGVVAHSARDVVSTLGFTGRGVN